MDAELFGYDRLAKAIIIQAIKDYRWALKSMKKYKNVREAKKLIRDVEAFFTSEWFCSLSDIDGRRLMKLIKDDPDNVHMNNIKNLIF